MALSLLANREVSTSSEEWKRECEIAYLLSLTPERRHKILYGVQGSADRDERGIKALRGDRATAQLASEVERLKQLKAQAN